MCHNGPMKFTATVKLQPSPQQAVALRDTLQRANHAANFVSEWAWQNRTFAQYSLHNSLYYRLRDQFSLSAQLVVRVIAKVAHAYKLHKNTKRIFRNHGSIAYDNRILNWFQATSEVTINTPSGRFRIPYLSDERTRRLL